MPVDGRPRRCAGPAASGGVGRTHDPVPPANAPSAAAATAAITARSSRAARVAGRLGGLALGAMIALEILVGLAGWPGWPAGLAAWIGAALLAHRASRGQVVQIGTIVALGLAAIAFALSHGASPPWPRLLDANAGLLTMIASVSFLRLVALPGDMPAAAIRHGPAAFRRTMAGVQIFGTFINISAPILIGDHLARGRRLSAFEAQCLTRTFSGCPAWSPFFGGMAVVLTLVNGMHMPFVMAVGLPFAVIGYLYVVTMAQWRNRDEVARFEGYPITVSALWVPALLAAMVGVGYAALPGVSILIIIATSALAVTAFVLWMREGAAGARRRVLDHVQHGLPAMSGELFLFLAAGVLAVGLRTAISAAGFSLPLHAFGPAEAAALLVAMIVVSALGAHPIIFIVVVNPLLLPLAPAPDLLAVTYLFGWSLGTCASPLSGTHLLFQGRYGIPSLQGAMRNWPFVAVMAGVGIALLYLVAHLTGA